MVIALNFTRANALGSRVKEGRIMIEVEGDIWKYKANLICIPTNGTIKQNGELVMGAGVAKQCVARFPTIALRFGQLVRNQGNEVHCLNINDIEGNLQLLATFPTKHHWAQKADIALIIYSAQMLAYLINLFPQKIVVLPRPGCGKDTGGLLWDNVKPHIQDILPDTVHVINLPGA